MWNWEDLLDSVIEGDCLRVMSELPDKRVDMVLCDLPYGITRNSWDRPIDLDALWRLYHRVVKDNGVITLFGLGLYTARLISSNPSMFRYKLVWIKMKTTNFLNVKIQPLRKHEDICVFYRSQPEYHPQMTTGKPYDKGNDKGKLTGNYGSFQPKRKKNVTGERYPADVLFLEEDQPADWYYCKTPTVAGKLLHPTQKPVELGRWLIRTYTSAGQVVLDNCCGAGSFLVAAILEGRRCIGIERQGPDSGYRGADDYVSICRDRMAEAAKERQNELRKLSLFKDDTI
jgi:DNA modification methylase